MNRLIENHFVTEMKYGKDFAYIRTLSTFAHVVGRYLKKQVDEQD